MVEVIAEPLLRNWPEKGIKLFIPGGWRMMLPKIAVDDDYLGKCMRHYMKQAGSIRGRQLAEEMLQATGVVGFRLSLHASIIYYAKLYCKMYPDRLKPVAGKRKTFTPLGYNPEVIQNFHVPDRYPGRFGLQPINKALMEMGI